MCFVFRTFYYEKWNGLENKLDYDTRHYDTQDATNDVSHTAVDQRVHEI